MDEEFVLITITRILAGATLLQSIEYLQLRRHFRPGAAWDWELLQSKYAELPAIVRAILSISCTSIGYPIVLWFRLGASALLWIDPTPVSLTILLWTSIIIAIRSLGTFNGGSDSMTLMLLAVLLLLRIGETSLLAKQVGIVYIAVQSLLSYFLAGCAKLGSTSWRKGWAMTALSEFPAYHVPKIFSSRAVSMRGVGGKWVCWIVLCFECSLPLALVNSYLCWIYLGFSLVFHVLIYFIFGLNRFVFVWIATYPALLYVAML